MDYRSRLAVTRVTSACWRVALRPPPHALELAKKTVNAGAGVPTEAGRWSSNQSFLTTTIWPDTQAKIGKLMDMGLQQDNDLELNFGIRIGGIAG